MTYDRIAEMALCKPEVVEASGCLKRGKRTMIGVKKDGLDISVKLSWEDHDRLLDAHPEVFYKTPHYDGWPWFLARLEMLTEPLAAELIECAWRDGTKSAKLKRG